jgi:hypothetical protein
LALEKKATENHSLKHDVKLSVCLLFLVMAKPKALFMPELVCGMRYEATHGTLITN